MIPRYSRKEMSDIWSDHSRFSLWLEIELLVLEAMVKQGTVPESALKNARSKATFSVERILEIEAKVKHNVIAFLTCINESIGDDSRFLHLGMTSSDLLDTTLAVQLTRATDLILSGLEKVLSTLKNQALKYKNTVCVGRSHGIHAEPTTFGLKVATWYAELKRQYERVRSARDEIAVGMISGPVGTYAHLNPEVEAFVCAKLGLKQEAVSTQVIPRDRHARLFTAFAELASSFERICVEVRHLQRTEVREAEEQFTTGQKGSSAMPHKRNPILSENVTGLARYVRGSCLAAMENVALWHERDISHSSVERIIGPDVTIALDFIVHRVNSIVGNLVVYPEMMKANLDLTRGLVYSGGLLVLLAERGLSREEAYDVVQRHALAVWDELSAGKPASEVKSFQERIQGDKQIADLLSKEDLAQAFSLDSHLSFVDNIYARVFGQ